MNGLRCIEHVHPLGTDALGEAPLPGGGQAAGRIGSHSATI